MNCRSNVVSLPISRGHQTMVDSTDAEFVLSQRWHLVLTGGIKYARSHNGYLHRLLMNAPKGMDVDHINGDGLDNRRCNLRVCSHRENLLNQKTQQRQKSSKYKGVCFLVKSGKWRAQTKIQGKFTSIKECRCETAAAIEYDRYMLSRFGYYVRTNIL